MTKKVSLDEFLKSLPSFQRGQRTTIDGGMSMIKGAQPLSNEDYQKAHKALAEHEAVYLVSNEWPWTQGRNTDSPKTVHVFGLKLFEPPKKVFVEIS